jgi:hypothetical protein
MEMNWGVKYWSETSEFLQYIKEHICCKEDHID